MVLVVLVLIFLRRIVTLELGIIVSKSLLMDDRLNLFQKSAQGLYNANNAQKAYARLQEIGKLKASGELPPEETQEEKDLKKALEKTQGHMFPLSFMLSDWV